MHVTSKRFWLVNFLRLPSSAEQKISNLISKIPENTRFWLNFSLISVVTAYLVADNTFTRIDLRRLPGLLIAVAAVYFALFKAATRSKSLRLPIKVTFWVSSTAILLQLGIVRFGEFVAVSLSHAEETARFDGFYGYELAIPYTAAALILSLLVGSQFALIGALILALYFSMVLDGGVNLAIYSLVGSIAAILGVERYRTRNAISSGIMIVGLANIGASLLVPLIANQSPTPRLLLSSMVMGMLSALQSAAIASLVIPLYESAFGILTDMRLMELSNADNPLLRELAIRTPGTNHHSFIVGTLAEAAAKAIGANALLARTACLYHDIGKMAAPKMYIENQSGMENPHNKVTPQDSVRIITGHVRRGIKMGHESGLPAQIIDFIPQHHGTRILAYFYHKAKAQADARGETVNADDFRYPGPKPQTKEAVILMLADGAEAAVRSLHDHSEDSIRAIIKKIIDHIVADGQFDESDVTLQELNLIRESLIKTLMSIHHQRVSYPGFNPPAEGEKKNGNNEQPDFRQQNAEPPIPASLTTEQIKPEPLPVPEQSATAQTE